jgi:hypothetical protein
MRLCNGYRFWGNKGMQKYALLFLVFALLSSRRLGAQEALTKPNSPLLTQIFSQGSSAFFDVLSNPEKYKYQIIYTRINRNNKGRPLLENHYFNYNRNQFLYPASLVKLPLCLLALQKAKGLQKYGVNLNTPMLTDTADYCQTPAFWDSTQPELRPCLDAYIKKMMLVSDNDGYNRVYEFLGYDYIRETLTKRGLGDMRIVQRFSAACDEMSNLRTNPVYFLSGKDTIYKQSPFVAETRIHNPLGEVFMGKEYYDPSGYLFPFPRSFYYNNFVALEDMQKVLTSIFFPATLPGSRRFDVDDKDLFMLKKYMGMWPRESTFPAYPWPDNYKKYFMIGDGAALPEGSDIRIFNVVGRAYGVLADCAYIVDFKNKTEFMLSAIMYCNEDEILNDDTYEYYSAGLPFLGELGRLIYSYELNRKRKNKPDLTLLENLYK